MEGLMATSTKSKKQPEQERGTTSVSVRLPDELLRQIDGLARTSRRTRGQVMRLLLEAGLTTKVKQALEIDV
jgi:predicted transcriptional regulator